MSRCLLWAWTRPNVVKKRRLFQNPVFIIKWRINKVRRLSIVKLLCIEVMPSMYAVETARKVSANGTHWWRLFLRVGNEWSNEWAETPEKGLSILNDKQKQLAQTLHTFTSPPAPPKICISFISQRRRLQQLPKWKEKIAHRRILNEGRCYCCW